MGRLPQCFGRISLVRACFRKVQVPEKLGDAFVATLFLQCQFLHDQGLGDGHLVLVHEVRECVGDLEIQEFE